MKVFSKKEGVHALATPDGKGGFLSTGHFITPGDNDVPDALWDAHKDDPEVKAMLASGVLKVGADKAVDKAAPKAKGK